MALLEPAPECYVAERDSNLAPMLSFMYRMRDAGESVDQAPGLPGSPSLPPFYEDAEWSDLSMKDLVAIETTAKAFIRELEAGQKRLRALRDTNVRLPEFVDAEESADPPFFKFPPPEPPSPGSEMSELSVKDILAIETTARAFIREMEAARQRLLQIPQTEQEFEEESRKRARRLVQVMTSCPPPPERELSVSISPTHTPDSQAPDTPPDMRLLMAAAGDRTDLGDRLLAIHEAAMEAVEARAQQADIHEAAMEKKKKADEFELNESGANVRTDR